MFSTILVYCGTSQSNAPIRLATRIAASSGAHVTLGDTVERDWNVTALVSGTKQTALSRVAARMRRNGVKPSTILLQGEAADAVVQSLIADKYDLLVIDAPPSGATYSERDITMRLVKESPVSVLLARELRRRKRLRILAAVDAGTWDPRDADNLNSKLVRTASWLAQHLTGDVQVLHVWDPVSEGPMRWAGVSAESVTKSHVEGRDHVLKELQETIRLQRTRVDPAHVHVEIGEPRSVIPEFARDKGIDLIVIGTFARSGLSGRILGNSAHAILDSSPCSMLIVPRL